MKKFAKIGRLDLQFFADGGEGGTGGTGDGAVATDVTPDTKGSGDNNTATDNDSPLTTEAIERIVQSKVDTLMADARKENANLKKENEKLKKDAMSAEELKKYEDDQRTKQLEERDKAITARENNYYALNALLKANIEVGSDISEECVSLVMGADSKEIDAKIATLTKIVNALSEKKVDKVFKTNGRTPNGSGQSSDEGKSSIAEKLGKTRAEQEKKSNDVLKHYIGGSN